MTITKHLVVSLKDDGARLVPFITCEWWKHYDHPSSIQSKHGPGGVELFPRAKEAYDSAVAWLKKVLSQGLIEAEGWHEDTKRTGPITQPEWETRFIHFWKNELQHPQGRTREEYPLIKPTAINADDIRREVAKSIEAQGERNDNTTPSPRPRGRRPVQTPRVIAEMKADLATGYDLNGATEEELAAKYGASRDICRAARTTALSGIVGK
jgi:hypothetical protein